MVGELLFCFRDLGFKGCKEFRDFRVQEFRGCWFELRCEGLGFMALGVCARLRCMCIYVVVWGRGSRRISECSKRV